MSFDRPLALLFLAALPAIVGAYVLLRRRRPRYVVSFPNVDVLRGVAPRMSSRREHVTAGLVVVVLALLCVSAARPHLRHMAPVENATVVLVVDTSRSMLSRDVAPTRLGAAKRAAQSFLDRVPGKLRVGLVTFAGDVTVAASPTHDRERLRRSVAAITGSRPGAAPRSATRSRAPSSWRGRRSPSPGGRRRPPVRSPAATVQ